MDVVNLKHAIKEKHTDNFYIFTGPEIEVMHIYINKIAEVNSKKVEYKDTLAEIFKTLQNTSFLKTSYCYIIRDDPDFLKNEKLWETIKDSLGNNIVIFIVSKIDKRGKFYKRFKSDIVTFDYMKPEVLDKYAAKEIDLGYNDRMKLIDICQCDYSRILLEIDKIKQFMDANQDMTAKQAFQTLLRQGTIYCPAGDVVFEFVDAVLKRNIQVYSLLDECKRSGEATLTMLTLLFNNFKQVLQVQACTSSDIAKSTGLTTWQIKCAEEKRGNYSIGDLVNAMKVIRNAEVGIKSGKIPEDIAIDYVLVNIL